MIKLYNWFRLSDHLSFYIQLIAETILGVKGFFLLFIAALLMFGLPMVFLNFYAYPGEKIIDTNFDEHDFFLADLLFSQYRLALGDFYLDNFKEHLNTKTIWMFFFLTTFFTQVTMLNMIIAIMSDTFDKVTEETESHSIN